jgi:hypothetical protein
MPTSLFARYIDAFSKGFTRTLKELVFHALVLITTLLYWLRIGGFKAHFGESITPWLWAFCLIVAWHSLKAARILSREIDSEVGKKSESSIIVSPSGEPIVSYVPHIPHYRLKVYGIASTGVLLCALCSYLVWRIARVDAVVPVTVPAAILPPVSIFADCGLAGLPISIPAQSSINVIGLNHKFVISQNWGLATFRNDTEKPQEWPKKEEINEARRLHSIGWFGYRCDFSNHSQTNAVDVYVPIKLWFNQNILKEENALNYTVVLSPMDAGSHFVFYIFNDCPVNATAILSKTVSFMVAGEESRRTAPLNMPHKNPIEPFMGFFPSKVQWLGETPCE